MFDKYYINYKLNVKVNEQSFICKYLILLKIFFNNTFEFINNLLTIIY